jgi:chorismate synthase
MEGLPAGLRVDLAAVNAHLARRQQGYGRGKRQQIERDAVEVLSGIRYGRTLPGPVTLVVRNRDYENWRSRMSATPVEAEATPILCPRPGHADLAGYLKYELGDIRDILERSSARSTAALVAAGALCMQLLETTGVRIYSHVQAIGGITAGRVRPEELPARRGAVEASPVRCHDEAAGRAMVAAIDAAGEAGDTLGGVFEVAALGCPPGLGSPSQWDLRLDARLALAVMGIQAVKGVEIGAGFEGAAKRGSELHDEIRCDASDGLVRGSNNAGGIEGGISNGEPIVVRAAMKPLPTLRSRLASVDVLKMIEVPAHFERSDICAVPAAAVIGEAMVAFVLAAAALEAYGGDSMAAFLRNHEAARQALARLGHTGERWSRR